MCGICGIINRAPLTPDDTHQLRAMNAAMTHRGPDGEGEFLAEHVALAMRRLSIIDLAGGWQPLYNEDRTLVLLVNGEIYNHVELRGELQARGHQFATGSDGEVILHLYEERGEECVHALGGMFAFALWDIPRNRLMLARDRMGEKPLYLYETDDTLWFASEMKSLLRSGCVAFDLDLCGVDRFLHYDWIAEPQTALRNVRKLPAAHWLLIDLNTDAWDIAPQRYWCMEEAEPLTGDPAERIQMELDRITTQIIRADVPVGIALSGGIDSGLIAALAARKYSGELHAFSIGYPGRPDTDERQAAATLAEQLGVTFHEREISTPEMVAAFPDLVSLRDDPIADISGFSYYALAQLAREHGVPVLLFGQGGDELFWGYPWVQDALTATRRKDKLLRQGMSAWFDYLRLTLPVNRSRTAIRRWLQDWGGLRSSWRTLQRNHSSNADQLVLYDLTVGYQQAVMLVRDLYTSDVAAEIAPENAARLFRVPHPRPALDITLLRILSRTYLQENGLAQVDRLSMAASVEARLPLVDHRLYEIAFGLRNGGQSDVDLPAKSWLKKTAADLLPTAVMNRPKRGFTPPPGEWYQAIIAAYGDDVMDGYLVTNGVLCQEPLRRLLANKRATELAFRVIVLEHWCRALSAISA